jgi:hypothetical protein
MDDFGAKTTSEPVCPQCRHADHNWWEDGRNLNDGNEYTRMCPRCGVEYLCRVRIERPRFATMRADAVARRPRSHP